MPGPLAFISTYLPIGTLGLIAAVDSTQPELSSTERAVLYAIIITLVGIVGWGFRTALLEVRRRGNVLQRMVDRFSQSECLLRQPGGKEALRKLQADIEDDQPSSME